MIHPMNFQMPTDEEMHAAFAQGEAAVMAVFHAVAMQVAALAQQLAKQGAVLQELQARLAKSSHNSSKPPSSDGYGTMKRTASLRKAGDKPHGGQPGHEGQTLMAVEHPERTMTHEVSICWCRDTFSEVTNSQGVALVRVSEHDTSILSSYSSARVYRVYVALGTWPSAQVDCRLRCSHH